LRLAPKGNDVDYDVEEEGLLSEEDCTEVDGEENQDYGRVNK